MWSVLEFSIAHFDENFVVTAEEKERSRNLAIQEKKLELKRQRFDYQRRRDEELR